MKISIAKRNFLNSLSIINYVVPIENTKYDYKHVDPYLN